MQIRSKLTLARVLVGVALTWILAGSHAAHAGEPVAPAQTEVVERERPIEAARARVTVTAQQLSALQSLRSARVALIRSAEAAHQSVERVRADAIQVEARARAEAAEAEQAALAAAHAAQTARADLERARAMSLDRPLVAYDIAQHGRLTVNALTGSFDLALENGPGITLRPGDADALLTGHYQPAPIDPIALAAEATSVRHRIKANDAAVRASLAAIHGHANFYLLSPRFLAWIARERLTGPATATMRLAGGSSEIDRQEARRQIQLEYEDFVAWLHQKGASSVDLESTSLWADLIRSSAHPGLGLSIKTRPIELTHRFEPAGMTGIPASFLASRGLRGGQDRRTPWELTEIRPALAVIWNGATPAPRPIASQLESDFVLANIALGDLRSLLPTGGDPRVRRLLEWINLRTLPAINTASGPRRLARATLGPRKDDLPAADTSHGPIIDLRSSDYAETITIFVSRLAVGNRTSTDLDALSLDQSSGRVEAEFTLHHRHIWPTIYEARAALLVTGDSPELDEPAGQPVDAILAAARGRLLDAERAAQDAQARSAAITRDLSRATSRVASKTRDLERLASELARAQADLAAANDAETQAQREAMAARMELTELDARTISSKVSTRGRDTAGLAEPIVYSSREPTRK